MKIFRSSHQLKFSVFMFRSSAKGGFVFLDKGFTTSVTPLVNRTSHLLLKSEALVVISLFSFPIYIISLFL